MPTYAQRIESLLKRRSMSLAEFAKAIGVTYQAVKKIHDGKSKHLDTPNHFKAARFFEVDPVELWYGEPVTIPGISAELRSKLEKLPPSELHHLENVMRVHLKMDCIPFPGDPGNNADTEEPLPCSVMKSANVYYLGFG